MPSHRHTFAFSGESSHSPLVRRLMASIALSPPRSPACARFAATLEPAHLIARSLGDAETHVMTQSDEPLGEAAAEARRFFEQRFVLASERRSARWPVHHLRASKPASPSSLSERYSAFRLNTEAIWPYGAWRVRRFGGPLLATPASEAAGEGVGAAPAPC